MFKKFITLIGIILSTNMYATSFNDNACSDETSLLVRIINHNYPNNEIKNQAVEIYCYSDDHDISKIDRPWIKFPSEKSSISYNFKGNKKFMNYRYIEDVESYNLNTNTQRFTIKYDLSVNVREITINIFKDLYYPSIRYPIIKIKTRNNLRDNLRSLVRDYILENSNKITPAKIKRTLPLDLQEYLKARI